MSVNVQEESLWSSLPDFVKEVCYEYEGCIMSNAVARRYLPHLINFTVRSDDIFLITYPKAAEGHFDTLKRRERLENITTVLQVSKLVLNGTTKLTFNSPNGTTWGTKIIHHVMENDDNEVHLFNKYVLLENPQKRGKYEKMQDPPGMYEILNKVESPRLIKTHLRMKFLPRELEVKKPKIIYIARNPKDVAVSFYKFSSFTAHCPSYSDWSAYFHDFCRGAVIPGSWFDHVLPWWQKRNEPNVLFLKYEDMKQDLRGSVEQISNFLERPLDKKTLDAIAAKCSFDAMKSDPKTNPDHVVPAFKEGVKQSKSFMRKGQVGDWKTIFSVAQNEYFDALYQKKMQGTGLRIDFSLYNERCSEEENV